MLYTAIMQMLCSIQMYPSSNPRVSALCLRHDIVRRHCHGILKLCRICRTERSAAVFETPGVDLYLGLLTGQSTSARISQSCPSPHSQSHADNGGARSSVDAASDLDGRLVRVMSRFGIADMKDLITVSA